MASSPASVWTSSSSFAWLGDPRTARWAVMFVIIWGLVGFYMVLFIAAIKGVPAEVFEAARIDGAGRFRTAVSITIPLIRENVQTAFIYIGILALDAFVYMAALEPGGGPDNTTLVMAQQLFTTAFSKGQFGYACAMGVVLAVITLAYAGLVFAVNRIFGGKSEVSRMTQISQGHRPYRAAQRASAVRASRAWRGARYGRRQGGDRLLACGLGHLVHPGHPAVDLGPHVLVQDQFGDLRIPVRPPTALELRQLRQCLDDCGNRKLLPQFGDRRLRRA